MKIGLADMTQQDEITLIFQREIFAKGMGECATGAHWILCLFCIYDA